MRLEKIMTEALHRLDTNGEIPVVDVFEIGKTANTRELTISINVEYVKALIGATSRESLSKMQIFKT